MGKGPIKLGLVHGIALAGPALQVGNHMLVLYVTSVKFLSIWAIDRGMEGQEPSHLFKVWHCVAEVCGYGTTLDLCTRPHLPAARWSTERVYTRG